MAAAVVTRRAGFQPAFFGAEAGWKPALLFPANPELRPFIAGTLPEVMEKEPNDDFKKPHALDGSCVVNGKLEKVGDVDCFAVTLKKGQTLVASLEAHNTLRSPMDAMLQVLSADGFVLEENNDFHGLDPQLAFTAKKDGTYIARVYAFPAQPDAVRPPATASHAIEVTHLRIAWAFITSRATSRDALSPGCVKGSWDPTHHRWGRTPHPGAVSPLRTGGGRSGPFAECPANERPWSPSASSAASYASTMA